MCASHSKSSSRLFTVAAGRKAVLDVTLEFNGEFKDLITVCFEIIVAELVASVVLFSAYFCLIKQRSNTLHTPSPSRSCRCL